MKHSQVETILSAPSKYDADTLTAVRAHLETCEQCRAFAATVQDLERLDWVPYREEALSIREHARIAQSIRAQVRPTRRGIGETQWPALALGIAGLVIISLLAFSLFGGNLPQPLEANPTIETSPTSIPAPTETATPVPTATVEPTPVPSPEPTRCANDWTLDAALPDGVGCPSQVTFSQASQQEFEHGFMIWIASQDRMIVATWDNSFFYDEANEYDDAVDVEATPSVSAPEGFEVPLYGFGKLWREVDGVRDALGWALATAPLYNATMQSSAEIERITLLNGSIVQITDRTVIIIDVE